MKKIIFTAAIAFLFTHGEAALPPLYQTAREIKSLVSDDQLGERLQSGEVIERIEKNERGYLIVTNKNQLQVNIIYERAQRPGPVPYQLLFEEPIPIPIEK